jgi:hypothetical protein
MLLRAGGNSHVATLGDGLAAGRLHRKMWVSFKLRFNNWAWIQNGTIGKNLNFGMRVMFE